MSNLLLLGASSGSVSQALALDSLSPTGAYSIARKLKTAYGGKAIRVRRSSDNTETDIDYISNVLDESGLLSFCGVGSGFVVKIYDQSGSNRDLTQSTASNQPRIVNSGSLVTMANSKPAADHDGSGDMFSAVAISNFISASAYEGFGVYILDSASAASGSKQFGPFLCSDGSNGYFGYSFFNGSARNYNYGTYQEASIVVSNSTNYLSNFRHESGNLYNQINNGTEVSTATTNTGSLGSALQVGGGSVSFDGKMSELILFNSPIGSTSRANLITNINTFYGIF